MTRPLLGLCLLLLVGCSHAIQLQDTFQREGMTRLKHRAFTAISVASEVSDKNHELNGKSIVDVIVRMQNVIDRYGKTNDIPSVYKPLLPNVHSLLRKARSCVDTWDFDGARFALRAALRSWSDATYLLSSEYSAQAHDLDHTVNTLSLYWNVAKPLADTASDFLGSAAPPPFDIIIPTIWAAASTYCDDVSKNGQSQSTAARAALIAAILKLAATATKNMAKPPAKCPVCAQQVSCGADNKAKCSGWSVFVQGLGPLLEQEFVGAVVDVYFSVLPKAAKAGQYARGQGKSKAEADKIATATFYREFMHLFVKSFISIFSKSVGKTLIGPAFQLDKLKNEAEVLKNLGDDAKGLQEQLLQIKKIEQLTPAIAMLYNLPWKMFGEPLLKAMVG